MNFEEFCLARLPGLLRFAVMLTGERELAQDIVQEVLCRAHGRWRRIVATDRPELYVKRMITNEFLSWRRRRRVVTVPLDADVPLPDPAGDESDDLWQRLAGLPRQQRAVLVLRYYEGLSDLEIADALRCSAGTVRGYASRALSTLRIQLTDDVTTGESK
ncbi:MAG: SigE family RNA polymerase sigma factor [Geodermatophilaceae bacterium]|nr:SigE family RNA polymerase sigma factor [Geodermatophilaceae bacterium]